VAVCSAAASTFELRLRSKVSAMGRSCPTSGSDVAPRLPRRVESDSLYAARMNLDRIIRETPVSLALAGSPAYIRQALRTLRTQLGKAVEWKVIPIAPSVRLAKEVGRDLTMDPKTEAKLLAVAKQTLRGRSSS
jgi:hypothetical protein